MKRLPLIALFLALGGFAFGLIHLFDLRFEAGDNYPEYSSLRADPLGAKALYQSLDALVATRRHFRPLAQLGDGKDSTLLYLGTEAGSLHFTSTEHKGLETFVRSGGRLVISLFPSFQVGWPMGFPIPGVRPGAAPPPGANPPPVAPPGVNPPAPPGDPPANVRTSSIQARWGVSFNHAALLRATNGLYLPSLARREAGPTTLPAQLPVHSALYFDKLDPAWRVLYARREGTNQYPVLIDRPLGRGAVVLCADSYHFSNESLRRDRQPGLLAWFIGLKPQVIFEETHLGVRENPGIAALGRQYRLEGLFVASLLLAALFVWKNSVSFLPPYQEQLVGEHGAQVEGKDSAAGFINLLRRNVAPADLMKICLEQWNLQPGPAGKPSRAKLEAMQNMIDAENALEPRQRNPVEMYRRFCAILEHGGDRPAGIAAGKEIN